MADRIKMKGLTYFFFTFYYAMDFVTTFNIDIKNPYIYKGAKGSSFGYSVTFNKEIENIIVGAPFNNETNTVRPGGVFSCGYGEKEAARSCSKLFGVGRIKFDGEIKTNQMMGATVYSDNYLTMACAPRYKTKSDDGRNFIWLQGKCEVIGPDYLKGDDDWVWRPCVEKTPDNNEFGYCQLGFSGKLLANKRMLGGCPSYTRAKDPAVTGRMALWDSTSKFSEEKILNISDYLGYSVGSGKFSPSNSLFIIGGAPRANLLTGQAVIFQSMAKGIKMTSYIADPSNQPGSYFGSSMAVTNIDGDPDKLDDLVVGAPYYSSGQSPNEGAVYVYMNIGGGSDAKLKQKLYGDKDKNACFGYSIGSVGDLNKDGKNDIVVGAPWGGKDGRGVVYIYYGNSKVDTPLIFKQKLVPSELDGNGAQLNGFGYSFAEYYPYKVENFPGAIFNDVDGNKYPDLGIGAYKSDSVAIFRSRPVVTIKGTLGLKDKKNNDIHKINLFDHNSATTCTAPDGKKYNCIQLQVAFTMSGSNIGADGVPVSYVLKVDTKQKRERGFFLSKKDGAKKSTYEDVMTLKGTKKIETRTLYLVNNTKDVVHEMVITLEWDIKESGSCRINKKICPVANQMEAVMTMKTLPYIKGCSSDGDDICSSDLKLTMTKTLQGGGDKIQSGITKIINVHIDIKNKGENAYLNTLFVDYPPVIQPEKITIEDHKSSIMSEIIKNRDTETLQITLPYLIPQNKVKKVLVQFGVSALPSSISKIDLKANVTTQSKETNPSDNKDSTSLDIILVANLTITGNVKPEQLKWTKGVDSTRVTGPKIVHTFLLQNKGPSGVDTSDLLIRIPERIDDNYILNIISINLEHSSRSHVKPGECNVGIRKLDPLGLNNGTKFLLSNNVSRSLRRRRNVDEDLGCSDKGVACRIIKCKLRSLKKFDDVTVRIISTLVEATFESYIKASKKIGVYARFTSKVNKPAKDAAKDNIEVYFSVITPHITLTAESKPLAWWIILICVLAALLIIGIIYTILYKKKFFERKRPQDAEEEALKNGDIDDEEEG